MGFCCFYRALYEKNTESSTGYVLWSNCSHLWRSPMRPESLMQKELWRSLWNCKLFNDMWIRIYHDSLAKLWKIMHPLFHCHASISKGFYVKIKGCHPVNYSLGTEARRYFCARNYSFTGIYCMEHILYHLQLVLFSQHSIIIEIGGSTHYIQGFVFRALVSI